MRCRPGNLPGGAHSSTELSTVIVENLSVESPAQRGIDAGPDPGLTARLLRVVLDAPLRHALDYLPPAGCAAMDVPQGCRVQVPFGRRTAVGYVVGHAAHSDLPAEKLRPAAAMLDVTPLLPPPLLELLCWTADYYHHPPGEVLAGALPRALREGAPAGAHEEWLTLTGAGRAALVAGEPKRAPKQRELLQFLAMTQDDRTGGECRAGTLAEALPGWRETARALAGRGFVALETRIVAAGADPAADVRVAPGPALSPGQQQALDAIDAAHGAFATLLLQGATGSGKTEVYIRATALALARGGSVLILVPEIGLTPQLVGRFAQRFTVPIAVLHSALSDSERLAAWRLAACGAARIVIGTRSAVFAPCPALALVIVDEEHDASFKQQDSGCRYSARDVAVRRAQLQNLPIVLGSATPALETLHNALQSRYRRLLLPRRADQAPAPKLALVDLRDHTVRNGLATPVTLAIRRHLDAGSQVLVYINRRGYAPTLLCTGCGWIAPCQRCDARLTVHQKQQRLRCHHCGAEEPLPEVCRRCGHPVKAVGQGTERVEETLAELFPSVGLARLDRDSVRDADDLHTVMDAMLSRRARILIGTQMVTKGHHFPEVTLVVVLNADGGLFSTDYRAPERLAQTIVQVAGRAGRDTQQGEVLIQTEYPEHPLLQHLLAEGYEGFARAALDERAAAHWPPFARLALLRASAPRLPQALDFLQAARALAGRPASKCRCRCRTT